MKPATTAIIVIISIAIAGVAGYFIGHRSSAHESSDAGESSTQPATQESVVVRVETVPAARKTITPTLTAYGSVAALPERVLVIQAPFDCVVQKLLVSTGQKVSKGDAVMEIEPTPETLLAFQEARGAFESAEKDLKQVQQRYDMKLATGQELLQSQNTLRSAKLKAENLQRLGAGGPTTIRAADNSIVSKIAVQRGQGAPSSSTMMELLPLGQAAVRLGVDPSSAASLKADQAVQLSPISLNHPPIEAKIASVAQRISPDTRLVDVIVTLPADSDLPLEINVRGQILLPPQQGLVVPRDAALPDESGNYLLYTVKADRAVKHTVHLGSQSGDEILVIADDIKEGDAIIVSGNYQLQDGMEVKIGEAATQPTTTEPATTQHSQRAATVRERLAALPNPLPYGRGSSIPEAKP